MRPTWHSQDVGLPACLPACLPTCLPACLFACLPACLSTTLHPICPFTVPVAFCNHFSVIRAKLACYRQAYRHKNNLPHNPGLQSPQTKRQQQRNCGRSTPTSTVSIQHTHPEQTINVHYTALCTQVQQRLVKSSNNSQTKHSKEMKLTINRLLSPNSTRSSWTQTLGNQLIAQSSCIRYMYTNHKCIHYLL